MANKQQEGICPVCGNDDLDYYGYEVDGTISLSVECDDCHSQGYEWYSLNFIEHEVTFNGKY